LPTEAELISQLVEAHKAGSRSVDPTPYVDLDRPAAYRVQTGVMETLGATPGLLKTAVHPDGVGVASAIYAPGFGRSGAFALPQANLLGLELEVGLVLRADVPNGSTDEAEIIEAIDHYFVGVEVCGTRFTDRAKAGLMGGFADSQSAMGYVMDPTPRDAGADIHGFDVQLDFDGVRVHSGAAKHSFGNVLNSFIAYSRAQQPPFMLKAGTVITTGSLCGLVPISGTGHVVGRLGNHVIEFDIV